MKTDTDDCGAGSGFRHFAMTDKIGGISAAEETTRTGLRQMMQAKAVCKWVIGLHVPREYWLYGNDAIKLRLEKFFVDVT